MPRRRRRSKGGLAEAIAAAQEAHPGQRIALWFEDEARVGQKGRTTHRWWLRGQRPPGLCDKRFASAYLFAAVEPATGAEVALVRPTVSTAAMSCFLAELSAQIAPDAHAVLVLDQAGWHGARALVVPDTSPWCRCRPTRRSSTPWSNSGFTCASGISRTVCSTTTTASWMPAATLGPP